MKVLRKKYADYILKPFLKNYLKKVRVYRYNHLKLKIYPGVFHPKYFFSTGLLLDFLRELSIEEKNFCEVGCGSGLISLAAFQKKARVVAFDLNETAVNALTENFENNFHKSDSFRVYLSDLFDKVPDQKFDLVFINPPWFFKEVKSREDLAWNCGTDGEYFTKLFRQLPGYIHYKTEVFMILAENSELQKITHMATAWGFNMALYKERKIKWEKNFIFKLNFNGVEKSD